MKQIAKLFSSIGPVVIFILVMILLFGIGLGYSVDVIGGKETFKQTFVDILDRDFLTDTEEKIKNYMIVMLSFSIIAVLAFIPLWVVSFSKILTLIVAIAIVFSSFIIGVMGICVLVEADGTNVLTQTLWSIFGIILPIGSSLASGSFSFLGIKKA